MSKTRRRPLAAWQLWLRVGLTTTFVAVAGAGLITGMSRQPASLDASRSWFADQAGIVSRQTAESLALGQAQSELDRQARQIVRGQLAETAQVPFERYTLRLPSSASPSTAELVAGEFKTAAVLRYELPIDRITVGRAVNATFEWGRNGWRLADLGIDGRDLWEHEPVEIATAGESLVIGSQIYASRLPSLADQVETARQQVADFWSAQWPGRVVVVLPGDADTMDPLVRDKSASRLLAVATTNPGPQGPVIRVTINPDTFFPLPALAQQIVLRHEITHVAQNALRSASAPLWLTEGLAEYVGYRGTGIPVSVIAAGAFEQVQSSGVPAAFPSDGAFDFMLDSSLRSLGYEQGWAACRMVADRYGEARLIPFYEAMLSAGGSAEQRVDRASRQVLGISGGEFTTQWQGWLLDNA